MTRSNGPGLGYSAEAFKTTALNNGMAKNTQKALSVTDTNLGGATTRKIASYANVFLEGSGLTREWYALPKAGLRLSVHLAQPAITVARAGISVNNVLTANTLQEAGAQPVNQADMATTATALMVGSTAATASTSTEAPLHVPVHARTVHRADTRPATIATAAALGATVATASTTTPALEFLLASAQTAGRGDTRSATIVMAAALGATVATASTTTPALELLQASARTASRGDTRSATIVMAAALGVAVVTASTSTEAPQQARAHARPARRATGNPLKRS
jgi:hypothetical protein